MKTLVHREISKKTLLRLFTPVLLIMCLLALPGQSSGQAANSYNLIPNPDFELQNVAQLTGQPDNVQSPAARYSEVTGWQFSNSLRATGSNGLPTYYATNAPTGTLSNPFTNNPNGNYTSPSYLTGIPFTPYQYSTAGVHNGCISITAVRNTSSPLTGEDWISTTSTVQITKGNYYASFLAYKGGGIGTYYIGMQVGNSQIGNKIMRPQQEIGTAAWTRVAGVLDFTALTAPTQANVTIGHFPLSPSSNSSRARFHIDEVELYKIPTAGLPVALTCGNSVAVTIGEGSPIPGATYAWTIQGSSAPPFATTLTTSVTPSRATTYVLTVTLPNGQTWPSTVTVTGASSPTATPFGVQEDPSLDNCYAVAHFRINNYDPLATYTFTRGTRNPLITRLAPDELMIKVSGPPSWPVYATFTITATNACGSSTSDEIVVDFYCDEIHAARTTSAAPNPSSESLVLPEGATRATLLNSHGVVVRQSEKGGTLNVEQLPAGPYILRMQQDGKVVNQHIEVKH